MKWKKLMGWFQGITRFFLLLMQLNRRLGIYEEAMKVIPVPAAYQVPNG
jgi:hypothetical protein